MMDEKLAKEKLEDEAGIYFEYTRAKYDDATKVWVFTIANKDGRRVFRASKKEDFAPYIALSRHLKLDFENLIAEHVWIYGDEIEIVPNEEINQYCLTNKGWLALSDIVRAFIEKFGEYSKDNLLKSVTWKLVIDKNECSSSTYKKNEKPGWPNLNTRVSFALSELEDRVLNIEEVVWQEEVATTEASIEVKEPPEEEKITSDELAASQEEQAPNEIAIAQTISALQDMSTSEEEKTTSSEIAASQEEQVPSEIVIYQTVSTPQEMPPEEEKITSDELATSQDEPMNEVERFQEEATNNVEHRQEESDLTLTEEASQKESIIEQPSKDEATQQKSEDEFDIQLDPSQYEIITNNARQEENIEPSSYQQDVSESEMDETRVLVTTLPPQAIKTAKEIEPQQQNAKQVANAYQQYYQNNQQTNKINLIPIMVVLVLLAVIVITMITIIYSNTEYKIYFDAKGGYTYISETKAKQGETVRLPNDDQVSRAGYVLIGWTFRPHYKPYEDFFPQGSLLEMEKDYSEKTLYAIWGREMYVNDNGLNMRSEPNPNNDKNIEFALQRGTKVIMFEDCYQGELDHWAPVIAKNLKTGEEEILFTNATRLDYFYIDDLLFGNGRRDGSVITPAKSNPYLYAQNVCYLRTEASVKCADGRSGEEEFRIVITYYNRWGEKKRDEYRWTVSINDSTSHISLGGWGWDTPGNIYARGKCYIDIMHKNKNFPSGKEIRIANKEVVLH